MFFVRVFQTGSLLKSFIWLLIDFSGLRFIWLKIFPYSKDGKETRAPNFLLWIIGIYVAIFSIASQSYENRIDAIDTKVNTMLMQLSSDLGLKAFNRIAEIQNERCVVKPNLFRPISVFQTFIKHEKKFYEIDNSIIKNIIDWKKYLSDLDLSEIILRDVQLYDANLTNTWLYNADLQSSNFKSANLKNAHISRANCQNAGFVYANLEHVLFSDTNLKGAYLSEANLKDSILQRADLRGAHVENANFANAILQEADLRGIIGLTVKQLSTVETLYKAKLDNKLYKEMKKKYPVLFEAPSWGEATIYR